MQLSKLSPPARTPILNVEAELGEDAGKARDLGQGSTVAPEPHRKVIHAIEIMLAQQVR